MCWEFEKRGCQLIYLYRPEHGISMQEYGSTVFPKDATQEVFWSNRGFLEIRVSYNLV